MPINIPDSLPAAATLRAENIFVMEHNRASKQDIRPLEIIILNLMPKKIETETHLLRVLSNSPIQINVTLLRVSTHKSKNTSEAHLFKFYSVFDDIKHRKFDGMIVTGAPVELLEFHEVDYWDELCAIYDWAEKNVYSIFNICWGAQAALYRQFGIRKKPLPEKMFGVFEHDNLMPTHNLLRGFDETFYAPHSRHTTIDEQDIKACDQLDILASSKEAGVYIIASKDNRHFYISGHSEYDRDTLAGEYNRDKAKGLPIKLPINYFKNNDENSEPILSWKAHGHLIFSNWINYFVYQQTPFDLTSLKD